ncbi:MAG: helix-turn-helix domain-containing protein [Planctomycetes bacterium]|nr:helix-turn-helix domain-containing protein [Planctomycetota bacterium]
MVLIHEKIVALLEQRHLKKRDLARALGISPQTATDICKGRSAITLPHLRSLVAYFELRADFWLDESRELPDPEDRASGSGSKMGSLARSGLLQVDDIERLLLRLRTFLAEHRSAFLAKNPDLTADEKRVLGLADPTHGVVGMIQGS